MDRKTQRQICAAMKRAIKRYDAEEKALKAGYLTTQAHKIDKAGAVIGFGFPAAFGPRIPTDIKQGMGDNIKTMGKMAAINYDQTHPDQWIDTTRHQVKMPEPSEDHVCHIEEPQESYGLDMKEIEAENQEPPAQEKNTGKGK